MQEKQSKLAKYVSLFAMIVITIIAIANKNISVFYLLYLFWWDEFLKTFFDALNYFFKKDLLKEPVAYFKLVKSRFFFLIIYLVFIVVFFGLILDWKNQDLTLHNLEVLMLQNNLFNFSVLTLLLREIYIYGYNTSTINVHHILSKGIITLHLSLILGIFMWFFITQKLQFMENYATVIAIIPFLLLKIYFEVKEIQTESETNLPE